MEFAPTALYDNAELVPVVRAALSEHPELADARAEEWAGRLQRFAGRRPTPVEVEAALEALRLDSGEVAT